MLVSVFGQAKNICSVKLSVFLLQSRFDDEDLIQSVFFAHLIVSHVSSRCAICVQKIKTQKLSISVNATDQTREVCIHIGSTLCMLCYVTEQQRRLQSIRNG